MTQENEIRIKGRELGEKFLEKAVWYDTDTVRGTEILLTDFYEWLIQQGDLLTRDDHLDQLADAESIAVEDALYQRENMREEG